MINLLPPELKQEYRYARTNHRLLYWVLSFAGALFGVAIITGMGLFMMNNSIRTYRTHIAVTQTELASQDVANVQQEVTNISNNLKLMVSVLSKEILFSKLLAQLGSITPSGVILTNLSISQTEKAVDIKAVAGSYNAAAQLQANLADPDNKLFSNADIITIGCIAADKAPNPKYPCTIDIRALFTDNNPFLFINAATQKAGS
jgi:Tfp pilus assembly protein PilN